MNIEVAEALSGYLDALYVLNKNLIKLCGFDIMSSNKTGAKEILDIIQEIPRVMPYSFNGHTGKLELKSEDGLLEYGENLEFLQANYISILQVNYDFINNIRLIRNKYEHKMHEIKLLGSCGGSASFAFTFKVDKKVVTIKSNELINLIKQLNILFSKIVKDIQEWARQNEYTSYPYYKQITRFDFMDFNFLYECDLL